MRLSHSPSPVAIATAAAAQEPKKNPFRDAFQRPAIQPAVATKADPIRQGPRVLRPAEAGIGKLVPDVAFTDLAGKPGKLSDFKGAKLTVVAFTNTTCPICKKYAPSLARIEKAVRREGRRVPLCQPNRDRQARRQAVRRPLRPRHRRQADRHLRRDATTEVFVLDSARTVLYRGAIDDQYGLGYALEAPRTHYLDRGAGRSACRQAAGHRRDRSTGLLARTGRSRRPRRSRSLTTPASSGSCRPTASSATAPAASPRSVSRSTKRSSLTRG